MSPAAARYSLGMAARLALCVALSACGDKYADDPAAMAETLWERIHAEGYQSWAPAPGYEVAQASFGPHGDTVRIFVNPTLEAAIAGGPRSAWPEQALVVKDAYREDELGLIAAVVKQDGAWFWSEWRAGGELVLAGREAPGCVSCHGDAAAQDYLFTLVLP